MSQAPSSSGRAKVCAFCGRPAEIEITSFDTLVPLGPPQAACRYCLGRPNRREQVGEGAHRVRLTDLASGKTATGHPTQLAALIGTLQQQLGQRTITAAIRVSSYAVAPIELVCDACGGAVTPEKGGVVTWIERGDGVRARARVLHGAACANQSGQPLGPGCWEELDRLPALDITRFDEESMGYLTDVEIAWKTLKEA